MATSTIDRPESVFASPRAACCAERKTRGPAARLIPFLLFLMIFPMTLPAAEPTPGLLFIHGRLKPDGAEAYQKYLAGTGPLLAEFGAEVQAVGSGVESSVAPDTWPINALLVFPSVDSATAFLEDPRYLELKKRWRDRAYEELHLTLVEGRAPKLRTPREVAEEAFEDFRQGLAEGHWEPFLERLTDDFVFRFPMGRFQGEHRGKDTAEEFFNYVSAVFSEGITVDEVERVTAQGNRVVFEFADSGLLQGAPYKNFVAISLDVCGEKICGYREYFGLVGPPPEKPTGESP